MVKHHMNADTQPRSEPDGSTLHKALRLLTYPLLGPTYHLPMRFWRSVWPWVRAPQTQVALALPGTYAGVVGPLTAGLSYADGGAGSLAAALKPWSPWHVMGRNVFLGLAHAGISTKVDAACDLLVTWLFFAVSCMVLLAPLYLWLLGRRRWAT